MRVEVGVAYAGRDQPHEDLVRARILQLELFERGGRRALARYGGGYFHLGSVLFK
jgi:hypothetical protein